MKNKLTNEDIDAIQAQCLEEVWEPFPGITSRAASTRRTTTAKLESVSVANTFATSFGSCTASR